MRTVFIFLSIPVFLMLIQYSNGGPRRVRSLESDEVNNMMKKIAHKSKPYIDDDSIIESDELDEEEKKKVADAIEWIEKSEESNSDSNEQGKNSDKEAILSHFIDIDHEKVSQNSDED